MGSEKMLKCCVCDRPREREHMWIIQTTPDERAAIKKMGAVAADEYPYCRPCWRVVSDREKGAQLLKGMMQMKMRVQGAPGADDIGAKLYKFLLERSQPKPS